MAGKLSQYLDGLWQALCGRYPHRQLRQLEQLKIHINQDDRWLSVHPAASMMTERYMRMISPGWDQVGHEHIGQFRKRLFTAIRENPVVAQTFVPCYDPPLEKEKVNHEQ